MKLLKFRLSGKTAHFKRADVNSYAYFSYSQPPKTVLLGMLGAILGLEGYKVLQKSKGTKIKKKAENGLVAESMTAYPEFYAKLHPIKLAVVPERKYRGCYPKKIHTFNNSVGYASKEEGGNLIVREQWLEAVSWDVYLDLSEVESSLAEKLTDYLLTGQAVFLPYLGKNDHPAQISDVCFMEVCEIEAPKQIDSLYLTEAAVLQNYTKIEDFNGPYLAKDHLPVGMVETYNFYTYQEFAYTNRVVAYVNEGHRFYQTTQNHVTLYLY